MAGYVQDAIMLLGDSLTQGATVPNGYAQQLTELYNRKLDVIVRGFSGYNTSWIIPVFEKVFAKASERQNVPKVQLLTIWFGANDATLPGEQQHVPLPKYKQNLSNLIHMVRDPWSQWYSPETRIILITPPPVNTHQWIEFLRNCDPPKDYTDRQFDITKQYAEAAKEVGKAENIPVVDTWTLLWEACGQDEQSLSKFLTDGLHLTEEAYKMVFSALMKTISDKYPEIHYDRLNMVYPSWDVVTHENYMDLLKDSLVRK